MIKEYCDMLFESRAVDKLSLFQNVLTYQTILNNF